MQLALPFEGNIEYEMVALPPPPLPVQTPLPLFAVPLPEMIDALPPDVTAVAAERRQIVGTWQGGRHYVPSRICLATVWFHFAFDGSACISVRYEGTPSARVTAGRWDLTCDGLVLTAGRATIKGPFTIRDGVMQWAGEVLVWTSGRPFPLDPVVRD